MAYLLNNDHFRSGIIVHTSYSIARNVSNMAENKFFLSWFCVIIFISHLSYPELIVNVKTRSGHYTRQYLTADPEKDIVTIDFTMPDGTKTKALIDFSKSLQVLKTAVLGEMERGEKPIHTLCFILKFSPSEFISSDAVSKLRQKNPEAIRIPEEELKTEFLVMEKEIPFGNSGLFSGHVHQMCGDADKIYTSVENIKAIAQGNENVFKDLLSSVTTINSNDSAVSRCDTVADKHSKCICHYEFCLSWYPCALKYCDDNGQEGERVSYRCGIKTCGKCRQFQYHVDHHDSCFWETPFVTVQ
ncbi:out at first protein-like [Dendronephthya gigantea]|uniref:out at first protein-like n=1 Tax=Dendronephthya gigantea TaxID=151771 RepID=UPI00106970E1|nr:out at first protein-like [Dendronephthya gigantea]